MFDMNFRTERIPRYPICDKCKEEIDSEFRYRVENEVFCEDCFQEFVRDTFREYNEEIIR